MFNISSKLFSVDDYDIVAECGSDAEGGIEGKRWRRMSKIFDKESLNFQMKKDNPNKTEDQDDDQAAGGTIGLDDYNYDVLSYSNDHSRYSKAANFISSNFLKSLNPDLTTSRS